MSKTGDPIIKDYDGTHDYTKVTFRPDFNRFGMSGLTSDTISLFTKRLYDVAGTVNVKVTYYCDG